MRRSSLASRSRVLLAVAALGVAGPAPPAPAAPAVPQPDVAVVVPADLPEEGLELPMLRRIFRGDRQYWSRGQRVVLLVWDSEEREQQVLLERIYEMSESQYVRHWIGKIFRDEATSKPIKLHSAAMLAQALAKVPGAIALVRSDRLPPGAKVLAIDGHRPGDDGYPLR